MAPVKWKRKIAGTQHADAEKGAAAAEEVRHQGSHGQNGYQSRSIQCTRCGSSQETRKMQLHTPQGFRDIHCKACGKHERCLRNLCQCGIVWHRCQIHRVDPQVHATRKGLKKHGKVHDKKQDKEERKLSSWRKAPETIAKEDTHHKAKRRKMQRRKMNGDEHIRNVRFDTSRALPAEAIRQRIRQKASQAHVHHEVEAGSEDDKRKLQDQVCGRAANRKRKRINENCGNEDEHREQRGKGEATSRRAAQRKTLIELLEDKVARQMHDKNDNMEKREKAEGDEQRRGDPKAGTSSTREPSRAHACSTWVSRMRVGEVESITRLISTLRQT